MSEYVHHPWQRHMRYGEWKMRDEYEPGDLWKERHMKYEDWKEREDAQAIQAAHNPVVRPSHYTQYKIEPITFIMENDLPFWMGNVIKYVMRAGSKNGVEDLRKAARYIEMEINRLEGKEVL